MKHELLSQVRQEMKAMLATTRPPHVTEGTAKSTQECAAPLVQDDPDSDDAEAEVKVEWNPLRRVRGSAGPSGCHRRKEGWRMEDRSAAAAQQLMRMDAEDEALARQLAIEREAKKRMLRAAIEYGPY
jgi:hypothetical protein